MKQLEHQISDGDVIVTVDTRQQRVKVANLLGRQTFHEGPFIFSNTTRVLKGSYDVTHLNVTFYEYPDNRWFQLVGSGKWESFYACKRTFLDILVLNVQSKIYFLMHCRML